MDNYYFGLGESDSDDKEEFIDTGNDGDSSAADVIELGKAADPASKKVTLNKTTGPSIFWNKVTSAVSDSAIKFGQQVVQVAGHVGDAVSETAGDVQAALDSNKNKESSVEIESELEEINKQIIACEEALKSSMIKQQELFEEFEAANELITGLQKGLKSSDSESAEALADICARKQVEERIEKKILSQKESEEKCSAQKSLVKEHERRLHELRRRWGKTQKKFTKTKEKEESNYLKEQAELNKQQEEAERIKAHIASGLLERDPEQLSIASNGSGVTGAGTQSDALRLLQSWLSKNLPGSGQRAVLFKSTAIKVGLNLIVSFIKTLHEPSPVAQLSPNINAEEKESWPRKSKKRNRKPKPQASARPSIIASTVQPGMSEQRESTRALLTALKGEGEVAQLPQQPGSFVLPSNIDNLTMAAVERNLTVFQAETLEIKGQQVALQPEETAVQDSLLSCSERIRWALLAINKLVMAMAELTSDEAELKTISEADKNTLSVRRKELSILQKELHDFEEQQRVITERSQQLSTTLAQVQACIPALEERKVTLEEEQKIEQQRQAEQARRKAKEEARRLAILERERKVKEAKEAEERKKAQEEKQRQDQRRQQEAAAANRKAQEELLRRVSLKNEVIKINDLVTTNLDNVKEKISKYRDDRGEDLKSCLYGLTHRASFTKEKVELAASLLRTIAGVEESLKEIKPKDEEKAPSAERLGAIEAVCLEQMNILNFMVDKVINENKKSVNKRWLTFYYGFGKLGKALEIVEPIIKKLAHDLNDNLSESKLKLSVGIGSVGESQAQSTALVSSAAGETTSPPVIPSSKPPRGPSSCCTFL